jgi:predicted NBD/HSP70 family sugar kinase/biotin operon repressor
MNTLVSASPLRIERSDRSSNTQTILDLLRTSGPATQADISRATSLSRATVNNIVQSLRDKGTVEYQWKNRREALVSLSSAQGSVISVMVNDGSIQGSLFDFTRQERIDLTSTELCGAAEIQSSPAAVLDICRRLIELGKSRLSIVSGVAIAIESPIESSTGAIPPWAWQHLPHWKDVKIRQYFAKHLRLPLVIDNDANLAAFAEWTWGVGRVHNDFVYVMFSQRIGGGIIINGRIYHGGTGLAGEIGHMVIDEEGDLCFCGSRGCLSIFATKRAILAGLPDSAKPKTSLQDVVHSAGQGDAACQRAIYEAGVYLGKALANVVRVMGPSAIVVGGTLGAAGDILLNGLRASAEITNLWAIGKSSEFLVASNFVDAPLLGGGCRSAF